MASTRRKFIRESGPLSLISLLAMDATLNSCSTEQTTSMPSRFCKEEDGEVVYIGSTRKAKVIIKFSKANHPGITTSFLTEIIPPGDYIPEHKHLNEDEFIFIQRGEAMVMVDEKNEKLQPGDLAFIPRRTWHGLKNQGNDYIHMLFGYSPAGFEDYFRTIGVESVKDNLNFSKEDWDRTSKKYGVVYRD